MTRHAGDEGSAVTFADLDGYDAWAQNHDPVGRKDNTWMLDFAPNPNGTYNFRPGATETRKYFARSIVRAFAPGEQPDGSVVFTDVDASTPWYRWASVAVQHGWMTAHDGVFDPDAPVTMAMLHRALVLAVGLGPAAKALNDIHTRDGVHFKTAPNFGTTVLGMLLHLRYNAPTGSEGMDVAPPDDLSRAQIAYSLARATTLASWAVPCPAGAVQDVELPHLGKPHAEDRAMGHPVRGLSLHVGRRVGLQPPRALGARRAAAQRVRLLGPHVVAASGRRRRRVEHQPAAPLPRLVAAAAHVHRYGRDGARSGSRTTTCGPANIMFYDGDGDGVVDHVDTYIGNGYALDSSSSPGGVSIMWVAGPGTHVDWYADALHVGPADPSSLTGDRAVKRRAFRIGQRP